MRLSTSGLLIPPHAALILLIFANVMGYLLCVCNAGTLLIPTDVLIEKGALTSNTLATHAYWRLFTYGFLHPTPLHLAMNVFSLTILAPHLERRLGASYFLLIYFGALAGGAVVSLFSHQTAFTSVGTSAAIYGMLGALFALWVLGKSQLSASFFLINFALNFAISARIPNADWAAHFGGFFVGIAGCALLDKAETLNRYWLRCKFPEFVKFNTLALIIAIGFVLYAELPRTFNGSDIRLIVGCWLAASLITIKAVDLLLSMKHGLAYVVMTFVIAETGLSYFAASRSASTIMSAFSRPWKIGAFDGEVLRQDLSAFLSDLPIICGCFIGVAAFIILSRQLVRGLKDTGLVAPTLLAERRRRQGI